jgi:hypothetical protein
MCSIFDVKPLGDDTDLNEMEKVMRPSSSTVSSTLRTA